MAISGRTSEEKTSKKAAKKIPALAVSAGIDHCRYRTNLVAMSVGPGIVLTTARPATSAPTACGHDSAGMSTLVGTAFATYAMALARTRSASCSAVRLASAARTAS